MKLDSLHAIHLLVIHGYYIGSLGNSSVYNIFCYITNKWPKRDILAMTLSRSDLNIVGNYCVLVDKRNESWQRLCVTSH